MSHGVLDGGLGKTKGAGDTVKSGGNVEFHYQQCATLGAEL